jgi:hypothetical protein
MGPDPPHPQAPTVVRLRESEERFRLLVENVRDYAIFMLDPTGVIASWNAGAERIKGYSAIEIIGRHFSIFYPAEDIAAGKPDWELGVAREQGRIEDEGWRLRKDGTRFWANVVITTLFGDTGEIRGFAKVTRDLTERRAREEAERRAALHVEASRLKDDFLAMVSHELRTPLNVAVGQAAMLRAGRIAPHQAERAWAALERNLALQARLIDDLLDLSRIVTGKLTLDLAPLDIAAVLRESVDEISETAKSRGVALRCDTPDAPVIVLGDVVRLRQVFLNLLSNAAKFTPPGGAIAAACAARDRVAEIHVIDTGIGISADVLPTVFDRFTQADQTTRREFGGLGLGLAIARELVMRHDGEITAASEGAGKGATFTVRLPLASDS